MTSMAWMVLALTALTACVDWFAVASTRTRLEYLAKPLTTFGLIVLAVTLDPIHADMRAAFVVALVLSFVGDVCLMLPGDRFVPGLAAFALAHLAYIVGFAVGPGSARELLLGVVIAAAVALPTGVRLLRSVRRNAPALVAPVAGYMIVITVMVAMATGWGNAWALVGAWLFFASDALIGETRFVRSRPRGRLAIIVTYHLGQAALVLSLIH
jgi:uncharacterized membrane protein YhhN